MGRHLNTHVVTVSVTHGEDTCAVAELAERYNMSQHVKQAIAEALEELASELRSDSED